MPSALLKDRAVILVSGPEAEHFLQNLITTDLDALKEEETAAGALLSPQGKILFDFLISRSGSVGFRVETRAALANDLVKRLTLYRLRAKAEIEGPAFQPVVVRWDTYMESDDNGIGPTLGGLYDMRFNVPPVFRHYSDLPAPNATLAEWTFHRVLFGVAESGEDYDAGDVFPHDILFDKTGGLSFGKGCYVGQEVVSRMQHRGTARRRLMLVDGIATDNLPPKGSLLTAGGKPIGTMGSSVERDGIAIVRIDKVADALASGQTILAGEIPVTLEFPEGMGLTLPEASSGPEEA
jgi:folate-binding protein YgfZ